MCRTPLGLCVQWLSVNQGLFTPKGAMEYVAEAEREEAVTEVTVLRSVDLN